MQAQVILHDDGRASQYTELQQQLDAAANINSLWWGRCGVGHHSRCCAVLVVVVMTMGVVVVATWSEGPIPTADKRE